MKSGFTLIELLVVLIIISLVSAFVAPRITAPLGNLNLKTASKKIVSALRYARSQAVSENEGRVAIFDFELRRLMLFKGSDLPATYRADELPLDKAELVYDLPENTRFDQAVSGEKKISEGLFQVPFFPNGSSNGGELILTNEGGLSYRIKIDFITGLASLEVSDRRADGI